MSSNFHVGQKVVCVKEGPWHPWAGIALPSRGDVYTVRAVECRPHWRGEIGILLEEVPNPVMTFMEGRFEPAFNVKHFRPVRTTDISIFTAMLAPTPRVKQPV